MYYKGRRYGGLVQQPLASAEMIMGKLKEVKTFSLIEGESPEKLIHQMMASLRDAPENSIILVDLLGGTPSNVISKIASQHDYAVVTGLNLGMLIEAEMLRYQNKDNDPRQVAEKLVESGKKGIVDLKKRLAETSIEEGEL
ncbi:PTS mannose transporter subunit IIA [Lacticaseibacillus paracasei]|nr:PTS mannose transporter subunit IIA [Lacticaseibacillus paracasei]PTS46044.1 PTS mannose transporter subunit IIA [Lactobacillus sp. DS1_6]PTS51459.1 PTS mannose transporter subunit IIA [Lactobacillus sp. DS2_6]PTV40333.1 PTS mannose transporter subunit IIA [Lactobacillus sp. DS13_6]MBM6452992.1 PTS mannose transporter subunit IIA [Lacticaseibacillus paracasei]MCR1925810.1 PTS mannose transporter subunit IIA [Lacticaseibacillus paracasei]